MKYSQRTQQMDYYQFTKSQDENKHNKKNVDFTFIEIAGWASFLPKQQNINEKKKNKK